MPINFADIMEQVRGVCDGRTFSFERQSKWAGAVRDKAARNALLRGFNGLFFTYRTSIVKDGSVAGQRVYPLPDDYIADLNVFFDGKPLLKPDARLGASMMVTTVSGSPNFYRLAGRAIELNPAPDESGKEIRMIYNAYPDRISGEEFTDYFIDKFPDLHVYGIAHRALLSIGDSQGAIEMFNLYDSEAKDLLLYNRTYWAHNQKPRLVNLDELYADTNRYNSMKRYLDEIVDLNPLGGE